MKKIIETIKKQYQFAVITDIPKDNDGNYACEKILINPKGRGCTVGSKLLIDPPLFDEKMFAECITSKEQPTIIDLTKEQIIMCNTPVFRLGEILIIDPRNDRTIPDGRKPSKWDVGCEYFDNVEQAIKRAKEVTK